MQEYLESSDIIDWKHPAIMALSAELSQGCDDDIEVARRCFEWVRDNIRHSCDYKLNPVTCRASDVLEYKTGYCYAKSHLLAALLRARQIPAGLCYQRLSVDDNGDPYCLHGLNAVYLAGAGWYRMDARGNKEGINAQFTPPHEQLAFATDLAEEIDFSEILAEPLAVVVNVLENCRTYQEVYDNLPDADKLV
jgi:transglutaminase-like putative cysteine protease